MESRYLAHYGVKGMKWGVRKAKTLNKHSGGRKREAKAEERKQKIIARNKAYMEEPGVAKHVKFDDEGYKITGISKALQKALDAPLEDIDDEELIFVTAMELGGVRNRGYASLRDSGASAMNTQVMQQQMQMQSQQALAEANRASINAGLQAASLSMTGGTNPFMFGMM